ncbi:MAG: SGNH/GDSL hydrolase family protein [Hyphomicrobiales bacterium]|nr:MAG: SGNH/GDSL hydrolase family protein [Hyphomicrobiales bacterium]
MEVDVQEQLNRRQAGRLLAALALVPGVAGMTRTAWASAPAAAGVNAGPGLPASLLADLDLLRQKRILFLHHSVGDNILEGLRAIEATSAAGARVNIQDVSAAAQGSAGLFEIRGGENGKPHSKIEAFETILSSAATGPFDLALMKLCYVDFDPSTDARALFERYARAVDTVTKARPGLRLVHATTPLTPYPTELKWRVYRMVGKLVWEDEANLKRAKYNELIRATFAGAPILDIAQLESTRPDGGREAFRLRGETFQALYPGFTEDDGHLNRAGQAVVSPAAVQVIAEALRRA